MQRYDNDDDERPSSSAWAPSASLAPLAPPYAAYAYDTTMVLNARLAVRRTIAQMIATPQQTVRSVVAAAAGNGNSVGSNCQQLNVVDPIRRLVSLHLETIYERLQCEIVSSNVHPPSSVSVMRFLQLHPGESTKEIVERFEMRSMDRRIHERDEWRNICITPLQELKECAKPANVPPLDRKALNSGTCSSNSSSNNKSKSSSKSAKHEMGSSSSSLVISDRDAIDSYGSSIISNDKLLSQSSANSSLCGQESSAKSYSLSCRQLEETDTKEDSSNQLEQKNQLDELAKKVTAQLMTDVDFLKQLHDGAFSLIRLNNNNTNTAEGDDERTALMEQIQRITSQHILPAILSKRSLIPSEPCTVVGDYYPTSTSQQQHLQNDDKVNGETKPSSSQRCQQSNEMSDCFVTPVAKTSTIDVSFPTEPCKEDSQQRHIKMVDVGVNTNDDDDDGVCEKIMEEKEDVDDDGSTSSNIAEDLSAGEIPQQLFESISQKQPVNVVTIRPDGSLVPIKETPIKRPFAREWFPRQLFRHSTSIDSSFAMRSVQIIKSFSAEDDEIECVSAKTTSKHSSPSAKDSNSTLAPISPIPHHC